MVNEHSLEASNRKSRPGYPKIVSTHLFLENTQKTFSASYNNGICFHSWRTGGLPGVCSTCFPSKVNEALRFEKPVVLAGCVLRKNTSGFRC